MYERIKAGWAASSQEFAGRNSFWDRSALVMLLRRVVDSKLKKYASGDLLDAGAGTLAYRGMVKKYTSSYTSVDFKATHPELDRVADIQALPFESASFDTVLCVEVLEHVPYPAKALAELYRVLRPGGYIVITVPHLGYLHNEPHDYYRFTNYGLNVLLKDAGFEIISIEPNGGFISFIQHIPATFLVGMTHGIPIIQGLVQEINRLCSYLTIWLDDRIDKRKLFAVHFVAVAKKSGHA
ncbi:MAG: methyltransferase domain-containing protein [Candidatus Andersenbacteria bacterium]|nr:methyltransferase domain-containing protein [Candidatus Andersenbacteria bacterium]MBI3250241.1 methyltransferase domain-containing protein [Candidatus Andersenbacteria bacterium]